MVYIHRILTLALVTCAYARPVAHDEMASAVSSGLDYAALTGSDGGYEGSAGGFRKREINAVSNTDGGYEGDSGGYRKRDNSALSSPDGGYEGAGISRNIPTEPTAMVTQGSNPDGGYEGVGGGFRKRDSSAINSPDGGYVGSDLDGGYDERRVCDESWGHAVLREVKFRDVVPAAMIYDNHPITDHFRYVNDNMVAGVMDRKKTGSNLYYFYLYK
ncbi:hypothetical protein BJX96DRAFT_172453 [Aspergillus floccosus]